MLAVMPIKALLMDFLDTPEKRERRLVHLPMGRFGEPIELARAALFCEFLNLFLSFHPVLFSRLKSDTISLLWIGRDLEIKKK